jgi:transposase
VAGSKDDPRSRWLKGISERRHKNIAAVALANKNARIIWALLTQKTDYEQKAGELSSGEPVCA